MLKLFRSVMAVAIIGGFLVMDVGSASAIPGTPGAPTIGIAIAGQGQATVAWTPPVDTGGPAIDFYTVTSSPEGHTATTANGTTLSATVTGLTNGTSYTFTVHATNSVGSGAESAASVAVTPATVPGIPTIGAVTPGNGTATISWSAPASDGGSAVVSYTVTSTSGGHTATTANGTTLSATVTGLTNGTSYTFTVHATNSVGSGAESAASVAVTPRTVPGIPTIGAVTPGNGTATISWSAPASDGGSAVVSYTVTSTSGGHTATTANGTTLSATVTGLTNGTSYTFTVHATNSVGSGAESAASVAVTPRTVPGAPTGVSASAGDASAAVTWVAPASNGGSAITSYTVTAYSGATAVKTITTTATSTTVTGLTNGTSYTFRVAVTNAAGTGTASASSNAITPIAPADPKVIAAKIRSGYWMVGLDGAVFAFGDAKWLGNAPTASAVDLEPTPSGNGYWVIDDQGRVFGFGDATRRGNVDLARLVPGERTISLSATPSGNGYWIFTTKGRVTRLRRRHVPRRHVSSHPQRPGARLHPHAVRPRLLHGGLRRRDLRLR